MKASTHRLTQTQKYKTVEFSQIIEGKESELSMKA